MGYNSKMHVVVKDILGSMHEFHDVQVRLTTDHLVVYLSNGEITTYILRNVIYYQTEVEKTYIKEETT